MTVLELANVLLDGENPKQFLRKLSADREASLHDVRSFIDAYIEEMLGTMTDDEGVPLDTSDLELAPKTKRIIEDECLQFYTANYAAIGDDLSKAGTDFWLTRSHEGAGFWDGDWEEAGERLTAAAHAFGDAYPYVGDDGLVYV